jgi:hypothetical protein
MRANIDKFIKIGNVCDVNVFNFDRISSSSSMNVKTLNKYIRDLAREINLYVSELDVTVMYKNDRLLREHIQDIIENSIEGDFVYAEDVNLALFRIDQSGVLEDYLDVIGYEGKASDWYDADYVEIKRPID